FGTQITSPVPNSTFPAGSTIAVSAFTAAATNPVAAVRFYANGVLTATDTNSPYNFNWTPKAGQYQLLAVAVDTLGNSVTSAAVTVTIPPFNVQIVSPLQGSSNRVGSRIPVSATVSNVVGPLTVGFYVNSVLTAAMTNAPYTFNWIPNIVSNYQL